MRVRDLIDDQDFTARKRRLDLELAALAESEASGSSDREWFEPAELLLSFRAMAVEWFRHGSPTIQKMIVQTVASNPLLAGKVVSADAIFPFEQGVNEPPSPYWSEWRNDIRIKMRKKELEFLTTIERVRKIISKAEEEGLAEGLPPLVGGAQESNTNTRVPVGAASHHPRSPLD